MVAHHCLVRRGRIEARIRRRCEHGVEHGAQHAAGAARLDLAVAAREQRQRGVLQRARDERQVEGSRGRRRREQRGQQPLPPVARHQL
eukprot:2620909-Prymnesium_polylepis.1